MKKILIVLLVIFSITAFVRPVRAEDGTSGGTSDCSRFVAAQTRYNDGAAKIITRTHDSNHAGNLRLISQRELKETKLITQLDKSEAALQKEFDRFRNRVKTEEQSATVEDYITRVSEANNTRRDKIIEAIVKYRDGTDTVIVERWTKLESSYFQYADDIGAVTGKAVADCEAGVPANEVRQTLSNDIKTLKEQLRDNFREAKNFDAVLRDIKKEQDISIRDANQEFRLTKRDLSNSLRGIF